MLAGPTRAVVHDAVSAGAHRAAGTTGGQGRGGDQEGECDGKGFEGFHVWKVFQVILILYHILCIVSRIEKPIYFNIKTRNPPEGRRVFVLVVKVRSGGKRAALFQQALCACAEFGNVERQGSLLDAVERLIDLESPHRVGESAFGASKPDTDLSEFERLVEDTGEDVAPELAAHGVARREESQDRFPRSRSDLAQRVALGELDESKLDSAGVSVAFG